METHPGIIIFCQQGNTPRLDYVLKTLFADLAGIPVSVTNQPEHFQAYTGAKLIYGSAPTLVAPVIPASALLFQSGISEEKPSFENWDGTPVLYKITDSVSLIPFDLFAASFWLLSRMEEYQPYTPDHHGRFPASESLMFQHGLLQIPLVNKWLDLLLKKLCPLYPQLKPNLPEYRYLPTIDVDSAWAYLHKPVLRMVGGIGKALLYGRFRELGLRIAVLTGLSKDPFNTFDKITALHHDREKPLIFFLLGEYSQFNKNQNPHNPSFQKLIRTLMQSFEVGIHPSYHSSENSTLLKQETDHFKSITGNVARKSRQHFLRMKLPDTYRHLTNLGIAQDYTMGFADQPGFRAGTCSPFSFYDLSDERETPLRIYPITVMDGTLRDYLQHTPEDALVAIRNLIDTVREYHGVCITLWHNESLSDTHRWKGWLDVYQKSIQYASAKTGTNSQDLPISND